VNGAPPMPLADAALVITGGTKPMPMVSASVPVPVAFVAPMVTGNEPPVVGVPEITPDVVFSVTPAGNAPVTLKLVGPFVAVIV
jgi:hypothetical protein